MGAVFIDLDRTLLRSASGPTFQRALVAAGVAPSRSLPGDRLLYTVYERLGENLVSMGLARATARLAKGWSSSEVVAAAEAAVPELIEQVAPFAPAVLAAHRAAGRQLVLATTTPIDMVTPLAQTLGFDDVIATRYEVVDGRYTGRLEGGFVWGVGKYLAVRRWARENRVDLSASHAYSDSFFDVALLSSVGFPHALNPDLRLAALAAARRWPIEYWDRPKGVPSIVGLEPYHLLRPFIAPPTFPYARFDISGLEHIPARGPVILVSNHRSYFDVAPLAIIAARLGRPVRFLGKQEIFDVPVLGWVARSLGGIPVERGGSSRAPMIEAEAALRAGEVVIILPQGTIPRGEAFFDPVLHGKTGAARLAASTGAPVVPIGLAGTEAVWPRSSKVPNMIGARPVTVRVGEPVRLAGQDAVTDTTAIMSAISALLPEVPRTEPTAEELARTFPTTR
jgi:putative phosphoserine phosphatase / 1-acylglycerol-3-phosphate O-acyltransferase